MVRLRRNLAGIVVACLLAAPAAAGADQDPHPQPPPKDGEPIAVCNRCDPAQAAFTHFQQFHGVALTDIVTVPPGQRLVVEYVSSWFATPLCDAPVAIELKIDRRFAATLTGPVSANRESRSMRMSESLKLYLDPGSTLQVLPIRRSVRPDCPDTRLAMPFISVSGYYVTLP